MCSSVTKRIFLQSGMRSSMAILYSLMAFGRLTEQMLLKPPGKRFVSMTAAL